MKTAAELEKVFSRREIDFLYRATRIVASLPDKDPAGELLRCHEVARVVGRLLHLDVLDGRYEYGCDHSWCVITRDIGWSRGFSILDPYTIGRIPPVQLICVIPMMPNRYFPEARRKDIREDVIEYLLRFPGVREDDGRTEEALPVQVPVRGETEQAT